mmetsp:Transcript_33194/g.69854  ORF Transcript_33194/g.69854 Transcript_33194/m.69854 type:complete len:221 (+) Transcript_33194:113-775(+)
MAPKAADWSTELFGSKILTKPKTSGVPTASSLGGKKLVLLYFSASWCPPCKIFTPKLIEFYNSCDVEVIFVSSDRDEKSFSDYFAKMPWLAMFPAYMSDEHRERQGKLADMFKIQGLPSVIVLDAKTGHFIADNARTEVMEASSDASKKALIQSWLSKEAVPIDQAILSSGGSDSNLIMKIFMFFAKRPTYLFGVLYFVKQLMRYLEEVGKGENADQKEL